MRTRLLSGPRLVSRPVSAPVAGVCVLWVRSCDRSDYVTGAGAGGRLWWFESGDGGLSVTAVRRWPRCEPWAWRSVETVVEDRRRQRGLCPACGYDLTANTSGRCSEVPKRS